MVTVSEGSGSDSRGGGPHLYTWPRLGFLWSWPLLDASVWVVERSALFLKGEKHRSSEARMARTPTQQLCQEAAPISEHFQVSRTQYGRRQQHERILALTACYFALDAWSLCDCLLVMLSRWPQQRDVLGRFHSSQATRLDISLWPGGS